MVKHQIQFEVDVPKGVRCLGYRVGSPGEKYLDEDGVVRTIGHNDSGRMTRRLIVEEVQPLQIPQTKEEFDKFFDQWFHLTHARPGDLFRVKRPWTLEEARISSIPLGRAWEALGPSLLVRVRGVGVPRHGGVTAQIVGGRNAGVVYSYPYFLLEEVEGLAEPAKQISAAKPPAKVLEQHEIDMLAAIRRPAEDPGLLQAPAAPPA